MAGCTPQQTRTTVPVALWDALQLGSTAVGVSAFVTAVTQEERFVLTPSALLTVLGEGRGGEGGLFTHVYMAYDLSVVVQELAQSIYPASHRVTV